jgi:hypothetical protein
MRLAPILSLPFAVALAAPRAHAQFQSAAIGLNPVKRAVAARADLGGITIDGRLAEAGWQAAVPFSDFVQRDPNEGQPGTERTEVRVLYTDDALYVGVRAYDSEPDHIVGRLTRRDEESASDWIFVAIDSYHDRRTAYVFCVNPAGVQRDVYLFNDVDDDDSWNAVWDVATTRDSLGWTAEFAIPFSQLRFPEAAQHEFGFNVVRIINRRNEEQHWRLLPKNESGVVSRFGDLVGLQDIKSPRRLELLPYAVAQTARYPAADGDPFADGADHTGRVGGDLRYGVTSNLTLNATINPDFGQVEADPAVVNLTAFETFFQEKRPFFNEGLDVFRFGIGLGDGDGSQEQLFYTRRIGRSPQGSGDPRGGYAESVSQTTILGAAKLSGKTPSGWTLGLLGAMTGEEESRVLDSAGVAYHDVVEPRTTYVVSRIGRDFRNGQSVIGFFGTGTLRDLPDAGNLDWLRSSAFTGGVNWEHRWQRDTYRFQGWLAGSSVHGPPEAIDLTQRSSARYFQRPDNDHVTYDPTRTSLQGYAGQIEMWKLGGSWRWLASVNTRSPGFEVNDLGFMRNTDRTTEVLWTSYRWTEPGKVFRRIQLNVNQWSSWSHGWEHLGIGGNLNGNFTLLNYWGGYFGGNVEARGLSVATLRGGPAIADPAGWNGWAGFYSDERKALRVRGEVFGWLQSDAGGTHEVGGNVGLTWQPLTNMNFQVSPGVYFTRRGWQYLDTQVALDSTRYLVGDLDQTTVSTQLRASLTFLPTLSLQLYVEPFVSAGRYLAYREVADPRGATFDDRFTTFADDQVATDGDGNVTVDLDRDGGADLALGDPDFRLLSLRSNTVLRWEYLPGSALFVVWQHNRGSFDHNGAFDLRDGLRDLHELPSANTFLVKVSYWISL